MTGVALAVVFWPAALVMLGTALQVFRTDSMARSGLLLLAALAFEGLVFLALGTVFLGVLTLLMMGIEMVIMVLFMVMFMNDPGGLMGMDMTHQKRTAAGLAGVGVGLAVLAALTAWPAGADGPVVDVRAIGFRVMGVGMFTFLFAGVALLFTMVGGIMLAKHDGRLGLDAPARESDDPAGEAA